MNRTVGPAIKVRMDLSDGKWAVRLDPSGIESALLNLAINTRDAMSDEGRLTFSTREVFLSAADLRGDEVAGSGDFVLLSVTDTGTGMPADVQARAFEPFFTTKPLGKGTGLGLSQIYGFVRQSGGLVRIDSKEGAGTTVSLYLPRSHVATEAEEVAAPIGAVATKASGRTILLVEDEAAVRALAAESLRDRGYLVLEAEDGPSGLAMIDRAAAVELLVTDVGLPGLNGRQLADAARERRPTLPVLFITGYAGTALNDGLPPGMAAIAKPFSLDHLAERVDLMLGDAAGDHIGRPGPP
ncbi:ATP-binding protein [Muricoccus vinaceus]|uniref:histidine kinase n=1 Tax=Muricoccus vinaceus TaxID=424704 RepID=A0ABV6ITE5_9PROT